MAEDEICAQEGAGSGGAYHAYLLRCWQEKIDGKLLWRFTLVRAGEEHTQKGFASLEDLTTFLREVLDISPIDKHPRR
jgi:hypothetical protein